MAKAFEGATRAAIEELIQSHGQPSKFGLILSEESVQGLIGELYKLLVTSRNLKAAGDRFMAVSDPFPRGEPKRPSPFGRPPRTTPPKAR